jgi:hypothetical protein
VSRVVVVENRLPGLRKGDTAGNKRCASISTFQLAGVSPSIVGEVRETKIRSGLASKCAFVAQRAP